MLKQLKRTPDILETTGSFLSPEVNPLVAYLIYSITTLTFNHRRISALRICFIPILLKARPRLVINNKA